MKYEKDENIKVIDKKSNNLRLTPVKAFTNFSNPMPENSKNIPIKNTTKSIATIPTSDPLISALLKDIDEVIAIAIMTNK